jgi:hypothetical protein
MQQQKLTCGRASERRGNPVGDFPLHPSCVSVERALPCYQQPTMYKLHRRRHQGLHNVSGRGLYRMAAGLHL